MSKLLRRLSGDETGATAIEYGLIVSLVVIAIIVSLEAVATESTSMWTSVSSRSQEAVDKVQL